MSGLRKLPWAVLLFAMVLSLISQAYIMALAAPAGDQYMSAAGCQNCQKGGCGCPCCQHTANLGQKSGCRCMPVSFSPGLPAASIVPPLLHKSVNYATFLTFVPRASISDIFHPPKADFSLRR